METVNKIAKILEDSGMTESLQLTIAKEIESLKASEDPNIQNIGKKLEEYEKNRKQNIADAKLLINSTGITITTPLSMFHFNKNNGHEKYKMTLFENEEVKNFKFEYNQTTNKFKKIETLESRNYLILKNNEWVKEELNNGYSLSANKKNLTFENVTFRNFRGKKVTRRQFKLTRGI